METKLEITVVWSAAAGAAENPLMRAATALRMAIARLVGRVRRWPLG